MDSGKPECCGVGATWVENIKDHGYWFCGACRNEVIEETHMATSSSWGPTASYDAWVDMSLINLDADHG